MAFTLQVYTSNSNYQNGFSLNLGNGNPYSLQSFEDAGPAEVTRLGQSSPDQHGITDLGFRLQPRLFVATVFFRDGNDVGWSFSGQDEDNQTALHSMFRPSHLVYLRLTRDDGAVRLLQCHNVSIEIDLVPEHYPSGLNRAVITLRAANPLWYSSVKTATFARAEDWVTGGTAIPSANVLEYGNYPAQGQSWEYAYPNSLSGAWSILFRSGSVPAAAGTAAYVAYKAGSVLLMGTATLGGHDIRLFTTDGKWYMGTGFAFAGTTTMPPGTINYIQTYDGTVWRNYRGGSALEATVTQELYVIGEVNRKWRSANNAQQAWPEEMPYYAIYNIQLSDTQRTALDNAILADIAGANIGTVTTVNLGDVDERPLITIRGPIHDAVLTNLATDDVIDLTGIDVASNTTLTLDLRSGAKSASVAAGTSYLGNMGTPTQLASFALAPAPVATGGTNLIRVTGGSITSDTLVTVTYYDRFVSF